MKTEQILLALSIAREKSVTKAAQTMIISQPTASNMLKSLEKEVGYRIFQRAKGKVMPTEEGKVFLEQAMKIEQALRTISQADQNIRQISFVVLSYHLDFSAQAFEAFCERYHSSEHTCRMKYEYNSSTDEAAKMVTNGNGDVAIVMCLKNMYDFYSRKLEKENLEVSPICEIPLELVCRKGHPILQDGKIHFELLREYPGFSGVARTSLESYLSFFDARLVGQAKSTYTMDPGPMRYRLLNKTNGFLLCMPMSDEVKNAYGLESLLLKDAVTTIFAVYCKSSPKESLIDEYLGLCKDFLPPCASTIIFP